MKSLALIVALLVMVLWVVPAVGGEEVHSFKAYYEAAIDEEITQCRHLSSLTSSRSPNLRRKGHQEASMAKYLETNRDELVVDMMKLNLEPKEYKVERYLNDRFSHTSYTDWEAK